MKNIFYTFFLYIFDFFSDTWFFKVLKMHKNLEKTIRPVKFHIFFDFLSKEKYCVNLHLNSYAQKTGIPMWNIHWRALEGGCVATSAFLLYVPKTRKNTKKHTFQSRFLVRNIPSQSRKLIFGSVISERKRTNKILWIYCLVLI